MPTIPQAERVAEDQAGRFDFARQRAQYDMIPG
jgi:hypothetical protein